MLEGRHCVKKANSIIFLAKTRGKYTEKCDMLMNLNFFIFGSSISNVHLTFLFGI
jgi:hypothetical protein